MIFASHFRSCSRIGLSVWALGLVLVQLSGCGPILRNPTPLSGIVADDAAAAHRDYRLLPGDQIEVRHILDPDYSTVVAIAPDGKIFVPGISQPITAVGQTLPDLTNQLDRLYRADHALNRPYFSLTLRSSANMQVFVSGEVQRPGYIDLGGGERHVLQLLASAGGFLPTARTNEVIVVRSTEPGQSKIFSVNIDKVIDGTDLSQNVLVRPLDVIMVPRSDIASLDVWVDQHIRLALPLPVNGSVIYTNTGSTGLLK
jgi:polysaccharide export outer membrane protein